MVFVGPAVGSGEDSGVIGAGVADGKPIASSSSSIWSIIWPRSFAYIDDRSVSDSTSTSLWIGSCFGSATGGRSGSGAGVASSRWIVEQYEQVQCSIAPV